MLLVVFYFQAPFWLIMVASHHRIARLASQGGSVLSMARAPRRACVKEDGFAQRALCQPSIQVGNLRGYSLPTRAAVAR